MTSTVELLSTFETKVLEFQEAFNINHPDEVNLKLIAEELSKVKKAAAHLLKEMCDLLYVSINANLLGTPLPPSIFADVLDPLYEIFPVEVFEEAFRRVHESNMSKLVMGKPMLRHDGKVLKGPNYKPPYLEDLIA